mgnify:FL=1|jgi:hypothetical protein
MKKTFNKMSIENNNNTYYKKVGRKYVPVQYYDVEGLQEGLWLIYKNKYSKGMSNMLYPILTHELQNVGRFCDFYKTHKEKIQEMVTKEYENFFQKKREANEAFSISDLTDCIIAGLSKIKDDEH